MRCSLLYLHDQCSRGGGGQRWGACDAGAGWGSWHRGAFAVSRLLLRVCVGNESGPAPGNLTRFYAFSLSRGPVFGGLSVFVSHCVLCPNVVRRCPLDGFEIATLHSGMPEIWRNPTSALKTASRALDSRTTSTIKCLKKVDWEFVWV